jgi:uncharacterized protein YecE (DUF72 family)
MPGAALISGDSKTDDANLVAPRARDEPAEEPADEPAEGLRQELLKLAIQLPPHFQRTIHAALSLRDWAEFCSALGTDSSHAERALLRAAKAIARRRGAEEPRSRGAEEPRLDPDPASATQGIPPRSGDLALYPFAGRTCSSPSEVRCSTHRS